MTAALSRRGALRGSLAASLGLVAGVAPVLAGKSRQIDDLNSDPRLIALGQEWQAIVAREERAYDVLGEREDQTREVALPEALYLQATDSPTLKRLSFQYQASDRRWFYAGAVDQLRVTLQRFEGRPGLPYKSRCEEIVKAYDAWAAEVEEVEAASGLTAAQAELDAITDEHREIRRCIMLTPATLMAGVLVKVRVVGWLYRGSAEMLEQVEHDAKKEPVSAEHVAFSAVADLVALMERGGAA